MYPTFLCDIFCKEVGRIWEEFTLKHGIGILVAPDGFLLIPTQLQVLLDRTVSHLAIFLPNNFLEGLWEKSMYDHSPSAPVSCGYWCVHTGFLYQALCPEVHIPSPFSPLPRGLAPSHQHVHISMTPSVCSCYEPLHGIRRYTSVYMQHAGGDTLVHSSESLS